MNHLKSTKKNIPLLIVMVCLAMFLIVNVCMWTNSYGSENNKGRDNGWDIEEVTTDQVEYVYWGHTFFTDYYYKFFIFDTDPNNMYHNIIDSDHLKIDTMKYKYTITDEQGEGYFYRFEHPDVTIRDKNKLTIHYRTETPGLDFDGTDIFFNFRFYVMDGNDNRLENFEWYTEIREEDSDNAGKVDHMTFNTNGDGDFETTWEHGTEQDPLPVLRKALVDRGVLTKDVADSMTLEDLVINKYLQIDFSEVWYSAVMKGR